jgi:hypothetical protein
MSHETNFFADEGTTMMSPDTFRVRLQQSGFGVKTSSVEDDVVELTTNEAVLRLFVEDGYVVEIGAETTFVNDRQTERLFEFLQSMGWVAHRD